MMTWKSVLVTYSVLAVQYVVICYQESREIECYNSGDEIGKYFSYKRVWLLALVFCDERNGTLMHDDYKVTECLKGLNKRGDIDSWVLKVNYPDCCFVRYDSKTDTRLSKCVRCGWKSTFACLFKINPEISTTTSTTGFYTGEAPRSRTDVAAAAGSVAGLLVFAAIVATLIVCINRHRKNSSVSTQSHYPLEESQTETLHSDPQSYAEITDPSQANTSQLTNVKAGKQTQKHNTYDEIELHGFESNTSHKYFEVEPHAIQQGLAGRDERENNLAPNVTSTYFEVEPHAKQRDWIEMQGQREESSASHTYFEVEPHTREESSCRNRTPNMMNARVMSKGRRKNDKCTAWDAYDHLGETSQQIVPSGHVYNHTVKNVSAYSSTINKPVRKDSTYNRCAKSEDHSHSNNASGKSVQLP